MKAPPILSEVSITRQSRNRKNVQRPSYIGNAKHRANETRVHRSLDQGYTFADDEDRAREKTSRPKSSDGSAADESNGGGSGSADERTDLEDAERDEIDPLDRVECVELAEHQGHGACC